MSKDRPRIIAAYGEGEINVAVRSGASFRAAPKQANLLNVLRALRPLSDCAHFLRGHAHAGDYTSSHASINYRPCSERPQRLGGSIWAFLDIHPRIARANDPSYRADHAIDGEAS